MLWKQTENDWLNSVSCGLMRICSEIDSSAAMWSPLTAKEREKITKHLESCGRIINRHAPKTKKK